MEEALNDQPIGVSRMGEHSMPASIGNSFDLSNFLHNQQKESLHQSQTTMARSNSNKKKSTFEQSFML